MASHTMKIAALGRPFTLGMLYDARHDEMIPGSTLWDTETLKKNTTEKPQKSTNFKSSKDDSIESKSSLLDVGASLKASFLGGLIEVGGSAKYLNDTKKSKNQSRVTCQYKTTTNFRELSVNQLASITRQQIDNIDKGCATHVVTGILYGANAFFVFDSEKLDASSVQDIQGSMEAVIKKIPKLNIEGKVDMKLTDEEKALTDKFSCKFYGDFILESNPATFEDAVKTYVDLPKLLGVNGENSVPLTVWLMPLKNWDPKAPELMSGISDELVGMAQDALEDLKQMVMRCNDALDEKVAENFPPIKKKLSIFKKACEGYAAKLKQTMKKEFPLIREGKDESSVKQVFEDRDKSPFSHEKLGKWMDHKESEIKIIKPFVEKMEGTKIVLNQSELDREVVAAGVEEALCFVFTSLESAEPCLDVMTKYLNSSNIECTHEELWRLSKEAFDKMSEKAKTFHYLAKALKNNSRFCFLIAAIANKKYTGATIYHYREGELITEDFSKPDLPPVEQITDKQNLIWYARDLTLDPDTVNGYLTLSEGDKKATYAWQSYPDHPERFDTHPQVMCKERLKGRHYWEVEWSVGPSTSVYIGVAYKGIERKTNSKQSQLGNNAISWCFGQYNSSLYKYHDGSYEQISFPSTGCSRVGVFLDWPAGTLSYYSVSSNSLSHLCTFNTTFTEPVYPCFWVNQYSNYVHLRLTD